MLLIKLDGFQSRWCFCTEEKVHCPCQKSSPDRPDVAPHRFLKMNVDM